MLHILKYIYIYFLQKWPIFKMAHFGSLFELSNFKQFERKNDHIAAERLSFLQGGLEEGRKRLAYWQKKEKNVNGKTRTNSLVSTTLKKFLIKSLTIDTFV